MVQGFLSAGSFSCLCLLYCFDFKEENYIVWFIDGAPEMDQSKSRRAVSFGVRVKHFLPFCKIGNVISAQHVLHGDG